MRWILAIAALMIGAPVQARAQQPGLPLWEVGTWCMDIQTGVFTCIVMQEPKGGVMLTSTELTNHGEKTVISQSRMTLEQGRVVTTTEAAGTQFRESARGPNALTMENAVAANVAKGDAKTVRFTAAGDDLTVEIGFAAAPSVVQHYKRVRE